VRMLAQEDRYFLLWNLYFGAQRYEKNGENDIAALLYYRVLEAIFDNALKDISGNFDRSNPDYSLFNVELNTLKSGFLNFRKKVFKKPNEHELLPTHVAMFDALCLLGSIKHKLVEKVNPGRVANIATIRNLSVYVHGTQPMTTQAITDIRKLATDTLQAYIDTQQFETIEVVKANFEFMELVIRKI